MSQTAVRESNSADQVADSECPKPHPRKRCNAASAASAATRGVNNVAPPFPTRCGLSDEAWADLIRVVELDEPHELHRWFLKWLPKEPKLGLTVAVSKLVHCPHPAIHNWILNALMVVGPLYASRTVFELTLEYESTTNPEFRSRLRKGIAAVLDGIDRSDTASSPGSDSGTHPPIAEPVCE